MGSEIGRIFLKPPRPSPETEFPGISTYLRRDVDIFCIWTFLRALRQPILRGRGSKPDI